MKVRAPTPADCCTQLSPECCVVSKGSSLVTDKDQKGAKGRKTEAAPLGLRSLVHGARQDSAGRRGAAAGQLRAAAITLMVASLATDNTHKNTQLRTGTALREGHDVVAFLLRRWYLKTPRRRLGRCLTAIHCQKKLLHN